MSAFTIDHRPVGTGAPCFIIAEVGVNHNGRLDLALQLVDVAHEAGADAVKFQTFTADRIVTATAPKAEYQKCNASPDETQLEMLRRLELSERDHRELAAYSKSRGLIFTSTPFDEISADFLDDLAVPVFKIPSGELTNLSYLSHMAQFGKPLVISTGMSYLSEVEAAVRCIEAAGSAPIALMHCVSSYPAAPQDANLRAMQTLRSAFGVPVGYSDHIPGNEVAFAAVALGACIIEKHLTLDRNLPGPDHQSSLNPRDFGELVRGIRDVEAAMGSGRKVPAHSEQNAAQVARKSLVAASNLRAGTVLTAAMIVVQRPGTGLAPVLLPHIIGRRTRVEIRLGDVIKLDDLV